jgi:CheY-like chemotaxis protein
MLNLKKKDTPGANGRGQVTVHWDNSACTVIRYDFTGEWTRDAFEEAAEQAIDLISVAQTPVDTILNFTDSSIMHGGFQLWLKRLIRASPDNQEHFVIVGEQDTVKSAANLFLNINKSLRDRLFVFDTMESARSRLAALQPTITRVLVIEDEEALREEVVDLLGYAGYSVVEAKNGKAGLTLAQESLPDIILCDVSMPKMDGFEVLMALRQSEATASIPLIFLTARADRSFLRHGMELGADDYLTKPFTHNELLTAVKARLARKTTMSNPN